MAEFHGYLMARLAQIGSRSEGPEYALQLWDYVEVPIVKKVSPWQEEPELHKRLGTKVTVIGEYRDGQIIYKRVKEYVGGNGFSKGELQLALEVSTTPDGLLGVRRTKPTKAGFYDFIEVTMVLLVRWPYRSIWTGKCPTTKTYDFAIYRGKGKSRKEVWRWSKGMFFAPVVTPVSIPGGDFIEFAEVTLKHSLKVAGKRPTVDLKEDRYTIEGEFVASGQKVERVFGVREVVLPGLDL
jgi:hypothetical protein